MKNHSLTFTFFLLVIAVHTYNLTQSGFSREISLRLARIGKLEIPLPVVNRTAAYFDPATAFIGGSGRILRYLTRQSSDWLFYGKSEPVQKLYFRGDISVESPTEKIRLTGRKVGEFAYSLVQQGISVIVVPIPTKLWLERNEIPIIPTKEMSAPRTPQKIPNPELAYNTFIDSAAPFAVDLMKAFSQYRKFEPSKSIFIPWDYHWTSLGAAIAARSVIERMNTMGHDLGTPEIRFVKWTSPNYADKLLSHLQLPEFFLKSHPSFEWREPLFELTPCRAPKTRIFVAGTSYTSRLGNTPFGFGQILAKALNVPVRIKAVDGGLLDGSIQALSDIDFKAEDTLVWEFPFHDVPSSPNSFSIRRELSGEIVTGAFPNYFLHHALQMRSAHPMRNETPPSGVMAPNTLMPVKANA